MEKAQSFVRLCLIHETDAQQISVFIIPKSILVYIFSNTLEWGTHIHY